MFFSLIFFFHFRFKFLSKTRYLSFWTRKSLTKASKFFPIDFINIISPKNLTFEKPQRHKKIYPTLNMCAFLFKPLQGL